MRIVVDSRLRTPPRAALLPANSKSRARVIIATTSAAPDTKVRRLEQAGAEIWKLRSSKKRVSLSHLAKRFSLPSLAKINSLFQTYTSWL